MPALTRMSHLVGVDIWAPVLSPIFQGIPTAPTAPTGTNSLQLATTEYVTLAISSSSSSGATTLSQLLDIQIVGPTSGQVLSYNGTKWVNTNLSLSLSGLSDVVLTSPTTGQVLVYNGSRWINQNNITSAPTTVTTSSYSMISTDTSLIFNTTATHTLTLLSAGSYPGRVLHLKNIAGFAINSASSNVVPLTSATPGTAILSSTIGTWCTLQSDGVNWQIMAGN